MDALIIHPIQFAFTITFHSDLFFCKKRRSLAFFSGRSRASGIVSVDHCSIVSMADSSGIRLNSSSRKIPPRAYQASEVGFGAATES